MFRIKKAEELSSLDIYKLHKYKKEFFVVEENSTHIWYEEGNEIVEHVELLDTQDLNNIKNIEKLKEMNEESRLKLSKPTLEEEILEFARNHVFCDNSVKSEENGVGGENQTIDYIEC